MVSVVFTVLLTLGMPKTGVAEHRESRQGPIEFTCDSMKVSTQPNRSLCRKNVVVRRGDLLLCCDHFVGSAEDDWTWTNFTCNGNVVAQRADELMWADTAVFELESSDLILTGHPLLKRARSYVRGTKITLNVESDQARVIKPRGVVYSAPSPAPRTSAPFLTGPVPEKCPLPPRPEK